MLTAACRAKQYKASLPLVSVPSVAQSVFLGPCTQVQGRGAIRAGSGGADAWEYSLGVSGIPTIHCMRIQAQRTTTHHNHHKWLVCLHVFARFFIFCCVCCCCTCALHTHAWCTQFVFGHGLGLRVPRAQGGSKVGLGVWTKIFVLSQRWRQRCTGAGCRFTSQEATRHRYQAK